MSHGWKRLATVSLALSLVGLAPASAQLASPVGAPGDNAASRGAAEQVAVPVVELPPIVPAVIEAPAPAPEAPDEGGRRPVAKAPPVASEFETWVSSVAGKPLRRFGSDLLIPGARDFTAPSTTAIPPDYRLNPGDELLIGLTGSVQASGLRLVIDSEGRIFVPRVGAIRVGGVRYGDVHGVIEREVSRQYRGFHLEVGVAKLKGITVYVTGFAARPGSYSASSLSTLVNVVLAAGGPATGGSFRSIQLRRGGQLISDFDLYDLLLKGDTRGDAVLQNGDVLYVAPAGAEVAVIGSINREAIFELAPGETLTGAIVYAGGVNTVADDRRLMVLNALSPDASGWRELSAADAASSKARRGDVIRILSNIGIARPLRQQPVLVTLSGEVARPGHYYVQPGTRMADVVAQAGGLTGEAFPYASVITRESVKHQQRLSYDRAISDVELLLAAQPVTSVNRAQLAQPGNIALINSIVDQLRRREPDGRLVFDLAVDAAALPGDLILENNDVVHVPARPVTVGVFGAVPSPASFVYRPGASVEDFVKSAGGVQNIGDKDEIFVVRANGTVLAGGKRALRAAALPGDLVYVPIDANRGEFWARLRDITGTLFSGLVGAASVAAITK
ncbi:SLBB domain-containing protein [Sphingopyxis sp. OPL5]|uniref:SLBB domain-containing protein n=1 Tax=Sphingopyxis sp. OPL5 TaxID=2486273 RepID=UPI00164D1DF9|nr:SLBB domain-containing protein [Sphingopyxis sp. OPL5]QNO28185.1 SLBB domain-containing protein [Sphingopyxis sp. OPL5]